MLEKGNYIPWESRFRRFLDNKLEDGEQMWNSIQNGPYQRPTIPNPKNTQQQILEPLSKMTEGNKKQYITDVRVMSYILPAIPNDICNSVDACKNANEMRERMKRLMFGCEVTRHVRHSRLIDEFDKFVAKEVESLESVYERLTTLVNIMDCNHVHPILMMVELVYKPRMQVMVKMLTRIHGDKTRIKRLIKEMEMLKAIRLFRKPRVCDAKYFQEQMLLAMKDEARSNLHNEENDFTLDTSYGEETMEGLINESWNPQVVAAAKLPILNPNEFDLWKIRIEQYFLMTNYSLWEVILNGDSPPPTRIVDGDVQIVAPTTTEQRLAKKNKLKARGTLLMALPDKHQLKFNIYKDAKSLMEAIIKSLNESVTAAPSIFAASSKAIVSTLPNTSSKNLSKLLESQVSDKTGLGFDSQVFNSQVSDCEELHSLESDNTMPKNLENDRYKTCEGYHDVSLPYTGTFMPPKLDLVFTDDLNSSDSVANIDYLTLKMKLRLCLCLNKENLVRMTHPHSNRNVSPTAVLTRSRLVSLNAARPVPTVITQSTMKSIRPVKHVVNKAHSPVRRPINQRPSTKTSNFNNKVTIVKVNKVNVVQDNKGTAEKVSACWVWKPKCKVLDHVSRLTSESMTLEKVDYTYALGRSKSVVAATKLHILNPNEFDMWKMRIEQYFLMTYYSLWEVILNGDSPLPTRIVNGDVQIVAPITVEQRLAKKNKLKARETLLMALPDKYKLKFSIYKDAKSLIEAIKKRLQNLISQLEILGETISQEDINLYHRCFQKLISQLDILGEIYLTVVGTSSTEAEYIAAASCSAHVLWIQNQLLDYTYNFTHTMIHIDNRVNAVRHFITVVSYELMLYGLTNVVAINLMLPVNPTIYVSCIKQFWASAMVKKVNDVVQLHALIDGNKVVVSEAIIRKDLHLDDADGIECLPNEEIFEELARMGYEKPPPKLTFFKAFFSTQWKFWIHTLVFANMRRVGKGFSGVDTLLFASMLVQPQPQDEEEVEIPVAPAPPSKTKQPTTPHESSMPLLNTLMETYATLSQKVAEIERDKHSQALEILQLKKRVKKLEKKTRSKSSGFKRLRRVEADTEVDAMNVEPQGRKNQEDVNAASKGVSVVGTPELVSAAEPTVFDDEKVTMKMAQTLIKLKAKKAKLLNEQIAQKLHDEKVQKAAARDKQEKANMQRALELQKHFKKLKAAELLGSKSTQEIPSNDPKEMSEEDVHNMLEIVPVSEFKVEALQVKYPIIDWEIHTEGFDREDLVALWNLVKEKFSSVVPSEDKEKALWVKLKRLFEPDADDVHWKLQRYMHSPLTWKLYTDCGISSYEDLHGGQQTKEQKFGYILQVIKMLKLKKLDVKLEQVAIEPNSPVLNENADEFVQEDVADFDGNVFDNAPPALVFEEAEMGKCDIICTPMATTKLDADLQGTQVDQTKYCSMVGGLMYLTASRPNIAFATFDYGFELIAYSDADLAGCNDDFKSTSEGIQFLGDKLVSWSLKKQDRTAMSTTEAEYISSSTCYAQVI
nr:hypothetical protein [Tanacetum cinerariifolium]